MGKEMKMAISDKDKHRIAVRKQCRIWGEIVNDMLLKEDDEYLVAIEERAERVRHRDNIVRRKQNDPKKGLGI